MGHPSKNGQISAGMGGLGVKAPVISTHESRPGRAGGNKPNWWG